MSAICDIASAVINHDVRGVDRQFRARNPRIVVQPRTARQFARRTLSRKLSRRRQSPDVCASAAGKVRFASIAH